MESKTKILIIGAGPAGLSTLKALKMLQKLQNYHIVCIQKQPDWSGQWNYTWRATTDQYGEHVHSSMYSQLWTNIPKQCFEFPDYTFKDHFGKSVPSYLPRQIFKGYFIKRFQKQNLRKYIKFNCVARNVRYLEKDSKFQVIYTHLPENKDTCKQFDYVVVATGHYSYPVIPTFKGIQQFRGKVVHCHQIRQFHQFKDRTVLVIGGSLSGQDVTLQCYKFGAKKIIWGYRSLKMKYKAQKIPQNIQLLQGISHFDQNSVYFQNGQERQIDAVLLCTGYIHYYPFMQQNLRLNCKNPSVFWPEGLYYSLVWEKNPKVFYIGMGHYRLGQVFADVQAYLIRDIISRKHIVPQLKQKDPNDIRRTKQVQVAKSFQELMNSGIRYIKQVIQLTGYPRYSVEAIIQIFKDSIKNREDNLITFRDVGIYKSMHTGQQSCLGKKAWLQMKCIEPTNSKSKQELNEFFQFQS